MDAPRVPPASGPPAGGADDPVSRLVAELGEAFERGESPRVEHWLAAHPGLREEDAVRLVYEEASLRQEAGETGVSSEVLRRFPQWHARLAVLLDCNRVLRVPPAAMPSAGDVLGDFHLIAELGRGATGRTFLASQRSLAHRRVVLKVTTEGQGEHLSLAHLQHMSIVPLYFEQVFPARRLQVLGMPDLGGAALSRVLDELREVPVTQRTGAALLEALDRAALPRGGVDTRHGPLRRFLARASYVEAVCWVGACLAEALQYAHDRGLLHLDVKPSNVLIAGDGQPMLLDFHLAMPPFGPGDPPPERIGGTPRFASPEQASAMNALRSGQPVTQSVDGRSDVYSLGVLLHLALAGELPAEAGRSRRRLSSWNPAVSPGLANIVARCLRSDRANRYPDAGSVAIDLQRHLKNLPLVGVTEGGLLERWRKWRRRRPAALPRLLLTTTLAAGMLAAAAGVTLRWSQRVRGLETALHLADVALTYRRFDESEALLMDVADTVASLPSTDRRRLAWKDGLMRVSRARLLDALGEVIQRLRFFDGADPPGPAAARSVYARGLAVWKARGRLDLAPRGGVDAKPAARIRSDLLDLATILAELRVKSAEGDSGASRRAATVEAYELLREARDSFGPSPALGRALTSYSASLGPPYEPVEVPPATTCWEFYDLGRFYFGKGDYARAEAELRRAVEIDPSEFWPEYLWGLCAHRLGRFDEALAHFDVSVALSPTSALCRYNRALAAEAVGRPAQARADYTSAIRLDARFWPARINRGLLSLREGKRDDALDDLQVVAKKAEPGPIRALANYNLARLHLRRNDTAAARACLEAAIADGHEDARELLRTLDRK